MEDDRLCVTQVSSQSGGQVEPPQEECQVEPPECKKIRHGERPVAIAPAVRNHPEAELQFHSPYWKRVWTVP